MLGKFAVRSRRKMRLKYKLKLEMSFDNFFIEIKVQMVSKGIIFDQDFRIIFIIFVMI